MYQKDFNEYIRILLRTQSSYKIMLNELDNIHHLEDMTIKQKQKLKAQLYECQNDLNKLIDAQKERNALF